MIYLDIWKVVTFLLFLATFASFTWAIPAFFRQLHDQPLGLRLIKYVGAAMLALSCVVHLTSQDVPTAARLAGAGLFILALALFWAAIQVHRRHPPYLAFSPFAPEHIVETGPYRLIRHPFYAAYALGWIANLTISASPILIVPLICMGALYVSAARLEERQFLNSPLSQQYWVYMSRTRMFIPFIW
jgi:protein-S-isoprenylcysteine O-methyltransferase Ste14